MYIYDMGIIDYFYGMTRLKDYIKLCHDSDSIENFYPTKKEIKLFLMKCFMHAKAKKIGWAGDIRDDDCIAISSIPDTGYYVTHKFIAFKQDNDGQSFIISECELDLNGQDGIAKPLIDCRDIYDVNILLNYYEECVELVEKLFSEDGLHES